MINNVSKKNDAVRLSHGRAVGFVIVGFAVNGASIEPSEITYVKDYATAMEFYADDAEHLELVGAYALPETSDFPSRDRLELVATNGNLPEEWQNPLVSMVYDFKSVSWQI